MKNKEQVIPYPVYNTKIPFDTNQLLMGTSFICPNEQCKASIGLSKESKPEIESVITKFENIKKIIPNKKPS
ncbi:MAG: hypothetical protein ABF260_05115 [Flavobacteriaceae bacterium]|jgi:hypothetical protein